MVAVASLSAAALVASAPAHAELTRAEGPRRPFVTTKAWDEGSASVKPEKPAETLADEAPRPGAVSIRRFPIFWVGVPGNGSLGPNTRIVTLVNSPHGDVFTLCLASRCPAPWTLRPDADPASYGASASARVVAGFGAVGAAALALFSSPTPKRYGSLAIRLSPMFAFGGAGLEIRGGFW